MRALTYRLRLILAVYAVLALIAGALLSFGADSTDRLFSWTIAPPLTAATLGGFYWTVLVLLAPLAAAGAWEEARPAAYAVIVAALLLLAATLIHLDRFDFDSIFGWFWLTAYVVAAPVLAWGIADQLRGERDLGGGGARSAPGPSLPRALRAVLMLEGVIMLAVGGLMFISPGTAGDLWPWALSPLTSRALGAFVAGIGLAALIVVRDDQLLPILPAARAYVAMGALQLLALLGHRSDLGADEAATVVYAAFLVMALLTGIYGWSAASASSRS